LEKGTGGRTLTISKKEKLQLALANARQTLGVKEPYSSRPLSRLNTLRGIYDTQDTRDGSLLSRTGVPTRPVFDMLADRVLGEETEWKPSVDLEDSNRTLAQIAAKRIHHMREKTLEDEFESETLGDSLGVMKDGKPIWAEVLDSQRGYSTGATDFGFRDISFRPEWPPVQHLSDHNTWKSWNVVEENSRATLACEKVIQKPGTSMNPLLILGDSGCGKSHLISASVQGMIRRQDGNVHLLSMTAMIGWDSLPQGWQDAVMHASLLAIDDLHLAEGTLATEIGMMIDYALNHGVQIIATSRVSSDSWQARRLWEVMRSATSIWLKKPSSSSLVTHLRRAANGRTLLLDDSMLANIVKYGQGDWRATNSAFEKIALAIETGERLIGAEDVSRILNDEPVKPDNVERFAERENLEEIASRMIGETLDHVYTNTDIGGVDLKREIPELSDEWEVPELTIEEKDELHEILVSDNLTPHVTTTLTVEENDKFLLENSDKIDSFDKVRIKETTSAVSNIADSMFENMARNHYQKSIELAELEQEMLDLADRSKNASVDELIAIADRVSEIEMILGNVSFDENTAILKPITKLNPI
tara:strand:+ start:12141 stop:13907 length:1767 start_codon:yes stop_codon:yes gene_type:complete